MSDLDRKTAGEILLKLADKIPTGANYKADVECLRAELERVKAERDGPGSPRYRLSALLAELSKRFPDAASPFASDAPEPKYLAAIDALAQAVADAEVLANEVIKNLEPNPRYDYGAPVKAALDRFRNRKGGAA